jgi:flagellar motor switch protein FliM
MARLEPILSNSEVKALLDVASRPSGPAGIVLAAEPVDLLADDRHLRLMIPALKVGYARVAESLRRVLTSVLRTKVEIKDEEPEILTGRGLMTVAEHASCLIVLELTGDGEKTHGVLALDATFAFSVIERLFGGGSGGSPNTATRSPTALERRMLLRAMQPVVDQLNATLEPPGFLRLQAARAESRLDLVPGYTPDMTVLHVPFTMTIGDRLASLSLATPAEALEPLRARLSMLRGEGGSESAMPQVLGGVGVSVSVELGRTRMTLRQVLGLQPGTVLTLDRNRSDELPVQVEGVAKWKGVPVQDDGIIAVEITGRTT